MPQIRFTISKEAAGYLRWLSENVLFAGSIDQAARHLLMSRIEEIRREHMAAEPEAPSLPTVDDSNEVDDVE